MTGQSPFLPEERREVPQMPISAVEVFSGLIRSHTAQENARMDDLKDHIIRVEAKLDNLITSLNSYMAKEPASIFERCEELIDEAIPTAKDNPDATPAEKRKEHRRAHAKWMQRVEDEMNRWQRMREKVGDWFVYSALGCIVVWILWSIQTYLGKPHP